MFDRRTSINSIAIRSDCNMHRPPDVELVTKNVRGTPLALFGSESLVGFDMQGLKPISFFARVGTTQVVP